MLRRTVIDIAGAPVNVAGMDMDDHPPVRSDALAALLREDLDPLSVAELEARIVSLEGEIARIRHKLIAAVDHRANADALFRR